MKKTLIALAIAGVSFNAAAVVDFDSATPSVPKFASEIKFNATDGTSLTNTANILDVTTKVGFSISASNQRYVRFDVTGAEFDVANIVAADLAAVSGTFASTVSTAGKTFVVFEIKDSAAAIAAADILTFIPRLSVKGANTVSLTYKLFETAVAAVANDPAQALYSKQGTVASFTPALAAKFTKVTPEKIDVALESNKFVGGVNTNVIGKVAVGVNKDVLWANGADATMAQLVAAGSQLEVEGDFSAGLKKSDGTVNETALTLGAANATTITPTKATFALLVESGDVKVDPITAVDLTFTVDGTTAIAESDFTAKYVVTPATGSTAATLNIGTLSELRKNGATANVDLALKPGGAFSNFVRVSNKSSQEGNFFVTVIADDGKKVTFPLSAVAGQPAALKAGESTTQMTIQQIFDAAAAKGLTLSGEGKLRLVVEGQVPAATTPTNGISVQTYTVAKDGNSFATFN